MDVVEGHDERPARRHRPEQVTQRDTRVLDTGVCARQAEQRPDPVGHLVGEAGLDQRLQPRAHVLGRVALVDASERLHRLGQRPVRHALAVGEAAARADRGRRLEPRQELCGQARLAHARGAEHGHELARALLGRAVERVLEHPSLAHTADEGRRCRAGPAGEVVVQRDHAIRRDGIGLPFQVERLDRLGDDRPVHEPVGGRTDQDLAHRRGLLEPRGGVHRVAGRHYVGRPRGADDDLARRDPDPHAQLHSEPGLQVVAEHADGLARLDRSPDAAKGIVLVRLRHPEQCDDGVADELLDVAAVALEGCRYCAEVAVHHPSHGLGVELLAELRRPGDVREEHGHDPTRRGRVVLVLHRSRAGGAEPGPCGQRLAAPRARCVHLGSMAAAATWCQGARSGPATGWVLDGSPARRRPGGEPLAAQGLVCRPDARDDDHARRHRGQADRAGHNRLTNTRENVAFIREAVAAGLDHIDTAHLYTAGESEETIGAALVPFPDGLVVATKGGYRPGRGRARGPARRDRGEPAPPAVPSRSTSTTCTASTRRRRSRRASA